ncbi:MAG: GNAT family N-acetyltransferase [Anaerolineae bacterium]|jgi:predicted acetyltransferase|nr:GNAT family N-acetyltransferase [Chloroflexota bacterium]
MQIRAFEPERDRDAIVRIWREIGWLKDTDAGREAVLLWLQAGNALVAEIDGAAECAVSAAPGEIHYLGSKLSFCGITGVATSHIARHQGLASEVTATVLAQAAAEGNAVAGLGMFEQGFYDRLGMGTGGYEYQVCLDPSQLVLSGKARIPQRVTLEDWEQVHAARMARHTGHGGVSLFPATITRAEMLESASRGFGLGYREGGSGTLSHLVWMVSDNLEHGPYHVAFMAYQTVEQLLELLRALAGLGDQVDRIILREPACLRLQDLVRRPLRQQRVTERSEREVGIRAIAAWQFRMLDVPACIAALHAPGLDLDVNLVLTDPIERHLPPSAPWRGIGGDYVLHLGVDSCATRGKRNGLHTITASAGAFSRLWLGAASARGLAATDALAAPDEILSTLDQGLRLPQPHVDWDL